MSELIPYIPDALTLAAVTGLGALLGKIWANRVSSKEEHKIQTMITSLRADFERSLHVHRVQFEKEFQIYLELSDKMVSVREALFTLNKALRPVFENDEKEKEYYAPLKRNLKDAFVAFRDTVLKNKPFYDEDVFIAADRIIDLALHEIITQDESRSEQMPSLERIMKMKDKVAESTEALVKAIRKRIGLLKVVN